MPPRPVLTGILFVQRTGPLGTTGPRAGWRPTTLLDWLARLPVSNH